MLYPSSIKKDYKKTISYKNRGMKLENLINLTNEYYIENDIALIYKKPTPILVVKVDYKKNLINEGYYKTPSTLDYNGIYKGKYIDFDAKETLNKTSFPLQNLHEHQLLHMRRVIKYGGISFLIIKINGLYFLLDGNIIIDFIDHNKRKSIPFEFIKEHGFIIKEGIRPALDYIKIVDEYYFKENFYEKDNL